jgi:hypothetical protein
MPAAPARRPRRPRPESYVLYVLYAGLAIHTPLLVLMTYLHARDLRQSKDRAIRRHESAH